MESIKHMLVYAKFKAYIFVGITCFVFGYCISLLSSRGSYPIYESELRSIRNELDNIRQEKQSLINDLAKSKLSLRQVETQSTAIARSADSEQKLTDYQNLLVKQEAELMELSNMWQELQAQLAELTESFQHYRKEAEGRIRRLSVQRNVCIIIGLVLVCLWYF